MSTGFDKQQQLSNVTAQKTQQLNQANQTKVQEMGADAEAIQLAQAAAPYTSQQMQNMQLGLPAESDQYQLDLQNMPVAALRQKYGSAAVKDKLTQSVAALNTERFSNAPMELSDAATAAKIWAANTAQTGLGLTDLALQNLQNVGFDLTRQEELKGSPTAIQESGIQQKIREFADSQREQYSPRIQYEQSVLEAQKEQYKAGEQAREAADIAKGDNPLVAGAKEQLRQFVNTAQSYGDKPGAVTALISESAPDILTGGLFAKQAAKGAVKDLIAEHGSEFATKLMATKVGQKQIQKAAERAVIAYTGIQEAGSNMEQALREIDSMSHTKLLESSPMYKDLINEGISPEQARNQLKTKAGNITGSVAGVLGAITGKVAAPFESKLFRPEAGGLGITDIARRVLGNVGKETTEEALQGASGQFASNIGIQQTADETKSLSEDIGSGIAESAIAGAGMGGVGAAITEVGTAAKRIPQLGKTAVDTYKDKRNQAKQDELRNAMNTANETIQATPVETPAAEVVQSEEAKKVFEAIPEEQISSPESVIRIAQAIRNREMDEDTRRELATVGNSVISAYEEALPGIQAELENAPEEQKAAYQTALDNINFVLNNPDVQSVKATAEAFKMSPEEVQKVFESLPSEITPETYQSPSVKKGVETVLAQMNLNSSAISAEAADKLIASADTIGLSPTQKQQLQVISATKKMMGKVGEDIRKGGEGFIGLEQYQQAIYRALALGDTKRAKGILNSINKFASHMEGKADAFENAARTFKGNQPVEVINPNTGLPYMSLDGKAMTFHPIQSKNLLKTVREDANTLRNAFNLTAQLIDGSLVQAPEEATAEAAQVDEPAPVTRTPRKVSEEAFTEEVQTPIPEEKTPEIASEEILEAIPEQGQIEMFGKPAQVEADINIETEAPVETDLMSDAQLDLGLDKGTNYDLINSLVGATEVSKSEKLSEADKNYQSTNQVKKWFKPTNKRSAFLRTSNFSGRLSEVFNSGFDPVKGIQNLFKGFVQPEDVNQKEVAVLKQFAALVPAVEQTLIQSWGKLTPEGQRLFWEKSPIEYFSEVREINGEKVYFLPQPVIEAMTAGMMQWFVRSASDSVNNDSRAIMEILGLDSKTNPTVEQVELLGEAGTDRHNVITDLSREIFGSLGIAADKNTPVSVRDAVSKALAAEVLNTMANAGMIQEKAIPNRELASVGSTKVNESNIKNTRIFVRMNPDSEISNGLVELMQDSNDLLGKLTNPQRERSGAYFGTPPKNQSTKVKNGGGQDIPEKMLEARNKASKQPHFINMGLHDLMLDKLGVSWIEKMLGIQSEEDTSGAHLKSIQGSNRTIQRDINTLINGLTRMVEGGKDLATTPIYFAYNVISNYRMMLNSGDLNPQAAKLHREMVTVEPSTIQLNNPQHSAFFDYAIAQGLDIAVDKLSSETARERLNKAIDSGVFRDAIDILKAAENQDSISDVDQQTLLDAVNAGKEKTKTLHALYAQAQYELAVEQGKDSFTTHVMLELDGVTNGPFNSIVQLGLKDINQELLDKLHKGGLFYGEKDRLYNDAAEQPGFLDLYKTAAAGSQQFINNMMDAYRAIPNRIAALKGKPKQTQYSEMKAIEKLQKQMRVTLAASKLIGDVNIVEGEDVEHPIQIGRGLLKNPVTVTVYSGGAYAINRKIAMGIVNGFYESITEAKRAVKSAATKEERDTAVAHINDIVSTLNELTTAAVYRNGNYVQIGSDIELGKDATQFTFTPAQIDAITQNIQIGIGQAVNQSIANEFGTVINRGKMMVYAAALMHELFMARWNKAVSDKESEMREAGTLSKYESLSQAQYEEIKQSLITQMPIFNSWFTAGNMDPSNFNNGILLSEEGSVPSDTLKLESRSKRSVMNRYSKTSFSPDMPTYTEPGTRVMPLLVQSVEAAMQAIARDINPNNALNVFDGYINAVAHLDTGSDAINQGVYQSWSEFNLLQDFTDRFLQATDGVDFTAELPTEANERLAKSFKAIAEGLDMEGYEPTNPEVIKQFTNQLQREAALQTSIKDGLFNSGNAVSINQMTGANIPFNIGEETEGTPLEQLVSNTVLPTVPSAQLPKGKVTIPPSKKVSEALTRFGRNLPKHEGVRVLTKQDVLAAIKEASKDLPSRQNRITQFILDKIQSSIPEDITVYAGNPTELSKVQQKLSPDTQVEFTSNFLGLTQGNNIYIGSESIETLLHELIHAATGNAITQFYVNPESLSAAQRVEIASIEQLMTKFLEEYTSANPETDTVINLIQGHVNSGDMAQATAEFVAWGLSNPRMIDALTEKKVSGPITKVLKSLAESIKRLFAIGSNPDVTSYWTRVLGHTVALSEATTGAAVNNDMTFAQMASDSINKMDVESLFNQLNPGNASKQHLNHLTDVMDYLQSNIVRLIKQTGNPIAGLNNFEDKLFLDSFDTEIDKSPDRLIANGFNMSEKEAMVFKMLQVSLKYGLDNFSPSVLVARSLYSQARDTLRVEDFLDNPNDKSQLAMELAEQRYEAVFGNTAVASDESGRSNRLANFIALAETNEQLRSKLSKISTKKTRATPTTTLKDKIGELVTSLLTWLSGLATKSLSSKDIASRLSVLAKNISHVDSESRNALLGRIDRMTDKITATTETELNKFGNTVRNKLREVEKKVPKSVAFGITAGTALFNDEDAKDVRTAIQTIVMSIHERSKLGTVAELVNEFIGTNETNESIHTLLVKKNMAADRARQIIREQVPGMIEKAFVSLTETEKASIQSTVAETDLASLYKQGYSLSDLNELISNPERLNQEISDITNQIKGLFAPSIASFYIKSATGLGMQMVHGVSPLGYQLTNASAIARLIGTEEKAPNDLSVKTAEPLIDVLASLSALKEVNQETKDKVSNVIKREMTEGDATNNGMTFTLNYYNSLNQTEREKSGGVSYVKGYTPTISDPNKKVVIASVKDEADLLRRGYNRGAEVSRDMNDITKDKMYYYHSNNGGEPRWVAGVMSTLQTTVGGVNPFTGRSAEGSMTPGVWSARDRLITSSHKKLIIDDLFNPNTAMPTKLVNQLQPVINRNGVVVGFQYQMPRANKEAHLDVDKDFTKVIGAWEGRMAEEIQAVKYNEMLMDRLHEMYKADAKIGNAYQYVTINGSSTDHQLKEIYELMPIEMKTYANQVWPEGDIKVRKDLLNNAFGYREPSVLNIWSGQTNLSKEFRQGFITIAETLLGKNAARYLRLGERGIGEFVKEMKDWIVVRSVVVSAANILSNMIHLLSVGINPVTMVKDMSTAVLAAEEYRRNEAIINGYSHYLAIGHNPKMAKEYQRKISELRDYQARNPVADLIKSGLLPTITEDLGQQDEYSLKDKLLSKMEFITNQIPDSVSIVGKELMMTRDSRIYFMLNRSIQYGDFVAKYSLYKHLTTRKNNPMNSEAALARVMDEFVNYDLLPSRARHYLDALGLTWFLNYKIRIQKILLRTFRENPLRTLLLLFHGSASSGLPNIYDANLVTSSFDYNIGLGTAVNGFTVHPLNELF